MELPGLRLKASELGSEHVGHLVFARFTDAGYLEEVVEEFDGTIALYVRSPFSPSGDTFILDPDDPVQVCPVGLPLVPLKGTCRHKTEEEMKTARVGEYFIGDDGRDLSDAEDPWYATNIDTLAKNGYWLIDPRPEDMRVQRA